MARKRLPTPKIGDFVAIWLMDHSSDKKTVPVFAAGVVFKINRRTISIDNWHTPKEMGYPVSEFVSGIDRRTIESIKIVKLPDPPED
jgi:hypothetical protein